MAWNEWLGCIRNVGVLLNQFADLAAKLVKLRLKIDSC
jgi:hypothetical protein